MSQFDQAVEGGLGLQAEGLNARHGKRQVLHGLDMQLKRGEICAIIGPNGCGKSTLLRCLAGLHPLAAGQISLEGQPLASLSLKQRARRLALLPQAPQAPDGMRVSGLLRHGRHPHQGLLTQWSPADEAACQAALRATDMEDLLEQPLSQLSGGQRQRAWLAMILAQETPYLLLDEPTSALDLGHQLEVMAQIRRLADQGRGIALVVHDLASCARYADRLVALKQGQVIATGRPQDILNRELLLQLYGLSADILAAPEDGAPVVVPRRYVLD